MNLKKIGCYLTSLALIFGLTACGNDISETNPSTQAGQQSRIPVQNSADPQPAAFSGKVVEKQDVSPYTYVRLDDGAGNQAWAAVPQTELEIGEEITLKDGFVMTNFTSKTLNRTFESIIFAAGLVRGSENETARTSEDSDGSSSVAAQSEGGPHGLTSPSSGGSSSARVSFSGVKVEKSSAQNAYTVGELFAEAASLNNRKVTVKGQVVKISPNIMGKNWIHIQDGTGDPTKNTHDLVVTSSAVVEKGAIVSLEGVLAADKDFGFGYKYDVLIEDAVVVE
jgi:DNA/RNA endonuclease YhcR with UshA esterase domain